MGVHKLTKYEGKTIKSMQWDSFALSTLRIVFTDGTEFILEYEYAEWDGISES